MIPLKLMQPRKLLFQNQQIVRRSDFFYDTPDKINNSVENNDAEASSKTF